MEPCKEIKKIMTLLSEQGKTQKDLTDYLGITQNAFTDWKSGRIKSWNKHLPQIAEFLGVTVDCILCKTEKPAENGEQINPHFPLNLQLFAESPSPSDNRVELTNLSEQEKALVKTFRGTTEEGRMKIIQATMNICDSIANDQLVPVYRAARSENYDNTEDVSPSQEHLKKIVKAGENSSDSNK